MTDIDWDELRRVATDAMARAYAPYSRYKVGAAALVGDGVTADHCVAFVRVAALKALVGAGALILTPEKDRAFVGVAGGAVAAKTVMASARERKTWAVRSVR